MPKIADSFDLTLRERPDGVTIASWLHSELCRAIFDGRLRPGARIPASRDFAQQYNISRGTVVTVFEQLQSEGYLVGKTGSGTWVNDRLPERRPQGSGLAKPNTLPPPLTGLSFPQPARPFRPYEPAINRFPFDVWARVAGRRLRKASVALLAGRDPRGYEPLRIAVTDYLGSSRGVNCSPDQVVITSGAQQGLDLLARLLLKAGDRVWMEDPGYFGAVTAFRIVGARIIAAPVDGEGIQVPAGIQLLRMAKCAYVTPAHQFPLGMTMSLQRRLDLLAWARQTNAHIIEDDYDSEYRFEGLPVPALQSLDDNGRVILVGSFNKLLFPALRIGFIVVPHALIDPLLALRFGIDQYSFGLDQAILRDFIVEGHAGRHIRHMRELYAARLNALQQGSLKYLKGAVELPRIQAGLYTVGFMRNGMTSRQAEEAAWARGVETMGIDRFTLERHDVQGLLLGFAAFDEKQIDTALRELGRALSL